ncbi:MAG TPA: sensor domain-containing protein [Mycobacterium sp.]|nr:sensor domain-containing protein [Mycobacterium sp.]
MRRLMVAFAVVALCIAAAGCGPHGSHRRGARSTTTTPTTTTTTPPPPVAEGSLKGLLLTPEQINPIMEASDMAVTRSHIALSDDSATMEPRECLAIDGAAQTEVYAGSGYSGVRDQSLSEGNDFAHYVDQAVVLFPTAKQATAFFESSAKQWPACHAYRHIQSGTEWTAEAITNSNGVLSTIATQENAMKSGWACGRALAVRNNVIVDVNTCSADPKDTAVTIANQIAAKVPVS